MAIDIAEDRSLAAQRRQDRLLSTLRAEQAKTVMENKVRRSSHHTSVRSQQCHSRQRRVLPATAELAGGGSRPHEVTMSHGGLHFLQAMAWAIRWSASAPSHPPHESRASANGPQAGVYIPSASMVYGVGHGADLPGVPGRRGRGLPGRTTGRDRSKHQSPSQLAQVKVAFGPAKYRACALDTHDCLPPDDHRATAKVIHRTRAVSKQRIKSVDPASIVQAWEASEPVMPRNEVTMVATRRLQGVQSSKWALLDALDAHECLESQRAERAARAAACQDTRQALDQQMEVWRLLRSQGDQSTVSIDMASTVPHLDAQTGALCVAAGELMFCSCVRSCAGMRRSNQRGCCITACRWRATKSARRKPSRRAMAPLLPTQWQDMSRRHERWPRRGTHVTPSSRLNPRNSSMRSGAHP
jgi:hypothetical protein